VQVELRPDREVDGVIHRAGNAWNPASRS
jgi:hypothetical protein